MKKIQKQQWSLMLSPHGNYLFANNPKTLIPSRDNGGQIIKDFE